MDSLTHFIKLCPALSVLSISKSLIQPSNNAEKGVLLLLLTPLLQAGRLAREVGAHLPGLWCGVTGAGPEHGPPPTWLSHHTRPSQLLATAHNQPETVLVSVSLAQVRQSLWDKLLQAAWMSGKNI